MKWAGLAERRGSGSGRLAQGVRAAEAQRYVWQRRAQYKAVYVCNRGRVKYTARRPKCSPWGPGALADAAEGHPRVGYGRKNRGPVGDWRETGHLERESGSRGLAHGTGRIEASVG